MSVKDSLEKLQYTSNLIDFARLLLESEDFLAKKIKAVSPDVRANILSVIREFLNKHIAYLENGIETLEVLSLTPEDIFTLKKLAQSFLAKSKTNDVKITSSIDFSKVVPVPSKETDPQLKNHPPSGYVEVVNTTPKIEVANNTGVLLNIDYLTQAYPNCDPGTYDDVKIKVLQYVNSDKSLARCALLNQPNIVFDVPSEFIEMIDY